VNSNSPHDEFFIVIYCDQAMILIVLTIKKLQTYSNEHKLFVISTADDSTRAAASFTRRIFYNCTTTASN